MRESICELTIDLSLWQHWYMNWNRASMNGTNCGWEFESITPIVI